MAYVNLYNNTQFELSVNVGGDITTVGPNDIKKFVFGSRYVVIESSLGKWTYDRKIIPYGGENSPYFDGTVNLQVNKNGLIYALKKSEIAPLEKFSNQPEGFPLEPNS